LAEGAVEPDWVSKAEAAPRLGISQAGFTRWAREAGITVRRRGNRPGVDWRTVEDWIVRSRVNPGTLGNHPKRASYRRRSDGRILG
jgi:hypothetical protein